MNKLPAFVLAALVALLSSCIGGSNSAPTPTTAPSSSTATPEATSAQGGATPVPPVARTPAVTQTPSATAIPTEASQPQATPTQPPATPAPTSTPIPTATPRPDGLQFHFGPGVDEFERALIVRAIEITGELLSADAEVRPPSAVFADTSPQRLEEAFAADALAQSWRAEGMALRMNQAVAEASYRGIVINTGHPSWQSLDATQRLRAIAHEYVHVVQLERAGSDVADATLGGPVTQAPPAGPFWLIEGTAEMVSWLVLQELNLGSYPESLFDYAADASASAPDLTALESFVDYRAAGSAGVGLATLSADYLLRSRSLEAIFDFWGSTSTTISWSASFNRHFGLPPMFYYLAFETYYRSIWEGFRP